MPLRGHVWAAPRPVLSLPPSSCPPAPDGCFGAGTSREELGDSSSRPELSQQQPLPPPRRAGLGRGPEQVFVFLVNSSAPPGRPAGRAVCKVTQPGTGTSARSQHQEEKEGRAGRGKGPPVPQDAPAAAPLSPLPGWRQRRGPAAAAPLSPKPAAGRGVAEGGGATRGTGAAAAPPASQLPGPAVGQLAAAGRHLPPAAADVRASPAPVGPRLPLLFSSPPPSPVTYITPWEGRPEHGRCGEQSLPCLLCLWTRVQSAVRAGKRPVRVSFTSRGKREEQTPFFLPRHRHTVFWCGCRRRMRDSERGSWTGKHVCRFSFFGEETAFA